MIIPNILLEYNRFYKKIITCIENKANIKY